MKRLRWIVVTGLLGVATAVGVATASAQGDHLPFLEKFGLVDEDTVRFTCREACPTFDVASGP